MRCPNRRASAMLTPSKLYLTVDRTLPRRWWQSPTHIFVNVTCSNADPEFDLSARRLKQSAGMPYALRNEGPVRIFARLHRKGQARCVCPEQTASSRSLLLRQLEDAFLPRQPKPLRQPRAAYRRAFRRHVLRGAVRVLTPPLHEPPACSSNRSKLSQL